MCFCFKLQTFTIISPELNKIRFCNNHFRNKREIKKLNIDILHTYSDVLFTLKTINFQLTNRFYEFIES